MGTLLCLAIMIFGGMACGRLVKQLRLPNVTGYLIAGLLLGPSVLKIIPEDIFASLDMISQVALGFIAFTIGTEFKISYFKRVGVTPIVIAICESFFAVLFVIAGLLLAKQELAFSLVLGAIAAATAPAATIMVIKQYKAKGPVTETLLSVVALDDAVALILFGIAVALANAVQKGAGGAMSSALLSPVLEISGALICGLLLGLLFTVPLRWFKKDSNRLCLTVAFVFAGVGIAELCGFSSLLLCMALGAALTNFSGQTNHIMKLTDAVTPPVFLLFFVASGAELQLSALAGIGLAGVIYVVLRVGGKLFGAWLGASLCRTDQAIKKYLGPALLPQAGVAIGLSLVATTAVPGHGQAIRTIVLCATLIYEIIGPAVSKQTLQRAGEIIDQPAKARAKA